MLNDFKFSYEQFACGRRGINKDLIETLIILHFADMEFYFTGSRYLESIHAKWKTDYDFFFNKGRESIWHLDRFFRAAELYRTDSYFNDNYRWTSYGVPKVDVFGLSETEFRIYKNANETIKSMPDAPLHTKRERIGHFDRLCGERYIRRVFGQARGFQPIPRVYVPYGS